MVKRGFTLVEAIISMLIIATVAIGAIPVLTKKKPDIETVTLRGQYACWVDDGTYGHNGKLMEWYFDERTPRTAQPAMVEDVGCRLRLDQRPAGYYILATGAGNNVAYGQLGVVYTPAISNELEIKLGRINAFEDSTTTIYNGSSAEVSASGADEISSSGLSPTNVQSCKLIRYPSCAKSCEVVQYLGYDDTRNESKISYQVRINGCYKNNDAVNLKTTLIPVEDLIYIGQSGSLDFDNVSSSAIDLLSNPNNNHYTAIGEVNGSAYNFELNFDFYNSSFVTPNKELGFTDNVLNAANSTTKSKMTKLIETISIRRQSVLTRLIAGLNPGGQNKNGAVLILW